MGQGQKLSKLCDVIYGHPSQGVIHKPSCLFPLSYMLVQCNKWSLFFYFLPLAVVFVYGQHLKLKILPKYVYIICINVFSEKETEEIPGTGDKETKVLINAADNLANKIGAAEGRNKQTLY